MYTLLPETDGRCIGIQVSGKVTTQDYRELIPQLEERIDRYGEVCILFEMKDFKGWQVGAAWEDIKFDVRHNRDIKRAALVGDKRWEEWMTKVMKLFAHAETRYFHLSEHDRAWRWIRECGR